ncbi:hypothetical protein ACFLQ8_03910 [Candidatus Auribacterota bacterium]
MIKAEKVRQEVEKRKKRAERLGLPELVTGLYMDHIQFYQAWIVNNRKYVPEIVTCCKKAVKDDKVFVVLSLKDKIYHFTFVKKRFCTDGDEYAELELFKLGAKCISLSIARDYNEYEDIWRPFDINAFIENEWINDFRELRRQIDRNARLRKEGLKNDPGEISRLRMDFGIV